MQFYDRNETSIQTAKDRADKKVNSWGNDSPMLYPGVGQTMVRILPPYSEAGVFFRTVSKHRIRVDQQTNAFACPSEEAGMPCAVCEKGAELTATLDETNIKFAKENLRPRNSYLYNVICFSGQPNRDGQVPEFGKVYVLETGLMVHRQVLNLDQDPAAGWANVTNAESGVTLIVTRTGQSLDTKYDVSPCANRTNIWEDLRARLIDPESLKLVNLDEVYPIPPSDKIAELVAGIKVAPDLSAPKPTPIPVAPQGATPAPVASPQAQVAAPAPMPTTAATVVSATSAPAANPSAQPPMPQTPTIPEPPVN